MKKNYINPFTDFGFKRFFGSEESKPILIDFLNALLPEKSPIVEITYKNLEHLSKHIKGRNAVFDIYCTNELGEKYIVEMQNSNQPNFIDRSVFYSTFAIQEQASKGQWNFELKTVYCVSIVNFKLPKTGNSNREKRVIHKATFQDQNGNVFFDKLMFIYIEIPNFNLEFDELRTRMDHWLYFLKQLAINQMDLRLEADRMIAEAYQQAELARLNPKQYGSYEYSLKKYRDLVNQLAYASTEGTRLGMEKGVQQGIEQGIEQGIRKGIEQERAIREQIIEDKMGQLVKKLIAKGMSDVEVSEVTELELEKIKKIRSEA